jgi:uncharacterized membrane protein YphA (DoxX/SURF4 family)
VLTLAIASLMLAYLFVYAGFSKPHADGSVVTPLDLIRQAVR